MSMFCFILTIIILFEIDLSLLSYKDWFTEDRKLSGELNNKFDVTPIDTYKRYWKGDFHG